MVKGSIWVRGIVFSIYSLCLVGAVFSVSDSKQIQDANSTSEFNVYFDQLRIKAEQGDAESQFTIGWMYFNGEGLPQDCREAVNWYTKAAEQGYAPAQCNLGSNYENGEGVPQNDKIAFEWYSKAAEQGLAVAQRNLGTCYAYGKGVQQDYKEAARWWANAAEEGDEIAQYNLSVCYANGQGIIENYTEAYKWMLLAGMNGYDVRNYKTSLKKRMTAEQIAEAQGLAKEFVDRKNKENGITSADESNGFITAFGTGFFISKDGLFLTAAHVVKDADSIQVYWQSKDYPAERVFVDGTLDVAVLKVGGVRSPQVLSLSSSSTVKTGDDVFTLGFPQVQFQGIEPKYTNGTISSLSGMGNDPKYFQISAPVQPGNSGGPLLDSQGRVVGLINSRLDDINILLATGAIPQNVNYALKSSFILPLLESVPDIQLEKPTESDKAAAIEKAKNAVGLVVCVE